MGLKKIFKDGIKEIKRKAGIHKAKNNLKGKENIKNEKLRLLGKKAWDSKLDIKDYPDLSKSLTETQKNQDELDEKVTEMNQRMQEYENNKKVKNSDFDNQRKRIEKKKSKVDSKLNDEQTTLKNTQLEKEKVQKRQKQIEKEEEQLSTKMSDTQTTLEEKTEFEKKQTQLIKEKKQLSEKIEKSSETIKLLDEKIKPLKEQSTQFEDEINIIRENQKEEIGELDTLISEENKKLNECRKKQEEVNKQQNQNFYQLGIQLSSASTADKMVASELSEIKNIEKEIESIKQEIQSLEDRASESKGAIWKMVGLGFACLAVVVGLILVIGMFTKSDTGIEKKSPFQLAEKEVKERAKQAGKMLSDLELDKKEGSDIKEDREDLDWEKNLKEYKKSSAYKFSQKLKELGDNPDPEKLRGLYAQMAREQKEEAEKLSVQQTEMLFKVKGEFFKTPVKWEEWVKPETYGVKRRDSELRLILTRNSGEGNKNNPAAEMLLAGKGNWDNYKIESSFYCRRDSSASFMGIVFGYQDKSHFYLIGYNRISDQFELLVRNPDGFTVLKANKVRFDHQSLNNFVLNFEKDKISFVRLKNQKEKELLLECENKLYSSGKFGLAKTGGIRNLAHFGPMKVISLKNSSILFNEDLSSGDLRKWEVVDVGGQLSGTVPWQIMLSQFKDNIPSALFIADKGIKNFSISSNMIPYGTAKKAGFVFGFKGSSDYYFAGYDGGKNRFEIIWNKDGVVNILARARYTIPDNQQVNFQLDIFDNRLVFTLNEKVLFDFNLEYPIRGQIGLGTSMYGWGVMDLTVNTNPSNQFQAGDMIDLLSYEKEASVIYQPSTPHKFNNFTYLINHSISKKEEFGSDYRIPQIKDILPQEATFVFPQGRFAEVHKMGFKVGKRSFPKEIEIWGSLSTPKSGFELIKKIVLKPEKNSYQEFDIKPVTAKYLKVKLLNTHGSDSILIKEMFVYGYFRKMGIKKDEIDLLKNCDVREEEPNNDYKNAQNLPLGIVLGAKVFDRDSDFYRISLRDQKGNTLKLHMEYNGIVRPGYVLFSSDKKQIEPDKITSFPGSTVVSYFNIKPEEYYLKITQPRTFMTIVYDDSDSMGGSIPIVQRVLKGFLDNLGTSLNLKLIKYSDKATELSDFTHDPEKLKKALDASIGMGGGTRTFIGLNAAIKSVQKMEGNRAILAIFDDLTGSFNNARQIKEHFEEYRNLWDDVLNAGIVFTTIGVEKAWNNRTEYFNTTQRRIFSELAYSSGGRFYNSPDDTTVEKSANTIFKQLTSPVQYLLRAELIKLEKKEIKKEPVKEVKKEPKVKKPGAIQVLFEKGAEKEIEKNIELILDASNSMWGQIQGRSKIEIAREVLTKLVRGLPDNINVGLRVYGHRYKLKDRRACKDTELMIKIGKLNKDKMIQIVNRIIPRGKTPLVHSILQTPGDFKDIGKGTVILISDGIESCNGDINSVASILKKSGLDLKVHIVGFDIKGQQARKQLEMIAESTGGRYLDAKNSRELLSSLEKTLQFEYHILNDKGKIVVKGYVGGKEIEVMEGSYTLHLIVDPVPLEKAVIIGPDSKRRFILKRENNKWIVNKE